MRVTRLEHLARQNFCSRISFINVDSSDLSGKDLNLSHFMCEYHCTSSFVVARDLWTIAGKLVCSKSPFPNHPTCDYAYHCT